MGAHPPYGSNIAFELHQMDDGSKAVRVVYNHGYNDTSFRPLTLKSLGCASEFCELGKFTNALNRYSTVDNWCLVCDNLDLEVCAGKVVKESGDVAVAFVIITPLLVITNVVTLLALVVCYFKNNKKFAYSGI